MLKRKTKARVNNSRNEYGLCECKVHSCSGIKFAVADGNQTIPWPVFQPIVPGTLCLYLHTQSGTMGAQSDWVPLEDIGTWLQDKNDPLNRQVCTACLQPAKHNFYKLNHGRVNLSVHKECLEKILSIPNEKKVELSLESSKKSKLAIALLNEDQRVRLNIDDKQYLRVTKDLQDRKDLNNITLELFKEWINKVTICYSATFMHGDSREILSLSAPFYKDHTLKILYRSGFSGWQMDGVYRTKSSQGMIFALIRDNLIDPDLLSIIATHKGLGELHGMPYKRFADSVLETYMQVVYKKEFTLETIPLLLIDKSDKIRALAEEYIKRVA